MASCFSCGKELEITERVGRQETCPQCGADFHCCRNCRFYDTTAYNECHEPVAERVLEKEKANFCDYFELSEGRPEDSEPTEDAKKKLEELFKKK